MPPGTEPPLTHAPTPAALAPTWFLDSDAEPVRRFALDASAGLADPLDRAIRIFLAVRDGIRYDPYTFSVGRDGFRASHVVTLEASYCVPKAILLVAAARAAGIPARLGFADVRNHLATEKLLAVLGTDLFAFHGYALLWLDGKWRKATPAFNRSLCDRFGVLPLDFDGRSDALLHPFDASGRRHMEYVRDRGTFDDLPYEHMLGVLAEVYGPDAARRIAVPGSDEAFGHGA